MPGSLGSTFTIGVPTMGVRIPRHIGHAATDLNWVCNNLIYIHPPSGPGNTNNFVVGFSQRTKYLLNDNILFDSAAHKSFFSRSNPMVQRQTEVFLFFSLFTTQIKGISDDETMNDATQTSLVPNSTTGWDWGGRVFMSST